MQSGTTQVVTGSSCNLAMCTPWALGGTQLHLRWLGQRENLLLSLTKEKLLFHSVPLPEQKIAAMTYKCGIEIQMYCGGCV